MKDFAIVFRVLYKNRYSVEKESNTGKRKLTKNTVMILSMLPMVAVICVILGLIAAQLTTRYSAMTLLNAILSAVQLFVVFMTLPTMLGTLYASEDAAFLSALPLRPTAVFFAKLLMVYISALKTAAVFLVPSMLTVSIVYAAYGNSMFYGFFPLIALIVAASPLLPVFLVVLFSMPAMWIGSYLKGRSVVTTVFSLLFYILLMAAYMALVFFINTRGFGQQGDIVGEEVLSGLDALAKVMYPNSVLISMCLGIDSGTNFGISLGIWTGVAAATVLLAALFYRRITSRRIEAHPEEGRGRQVYKRTPLLGALIKKDMLSIMRNPSLAMATFSNTVIAPVVMVIMYFFVKPEGQAANEFSSEMMMVGIVLLYPIIFLCGTNMVAMTAYSREGESFFISKFLPIAPKTSVNAKLLFSMLTSAAALAVIFVIAVALYGLDAGSSVALVVTSLLFCAGTSGLHIYLDIKKGNVHWKTQADMRASAGGGLAAILPVFISIIPAIGFVVAGVFMAGLEPSLGRSGVLGLYWGIILIVAAAVAAAGLYILYEKGVPLFEKIGENRAVSGRKTGSLGGRRGSFLK